jgi:endonuclease V
MDLIQKELADKVIKHNQNWITEGNPLKYVGAIDIRFTKGTSGYACIGLAVFDISENNLISVYKKMEIVTIDIEYQPGYLASRYLKYYQNMLETLKKEKSQLFPQLLFVRDAGILHQNRCGMASHIGILCDVPTIGVQERLLLGPNLSKSMRVKVSDNYEGRYNKAFVSEDREIGEYSEIVDADDNVLGVAIRIADDSKRPTFVSIGHRVSLDTAIDTVLDLSIGRVPEPIRIVRSCCKQYLNQKQLAITEFDC